MFDYVDFSGIASTDELWRREKRESLASVRERGMEFMHWLRGRREEKVACVSHGVFMEVWLEHVLNLDLGNRRVSNCDMLTLIL